MKYRFGSHMSIAGGYYRSVESAQEVGCDCVQLFTKNNNQWKAKPITEEEVSRFSDCLKKLKITNPLSHASYLINLASPDDELWKKSIDGMVVEWQRAEQLKLDGVVLHPGAFVSSDEESGMARVVKALEKIYKQVQPKCSWLLLENTAGQGTCLGWDMRQLGWMIAKTGSTMKIGICIDTCHCHAAGYDMADKSGLKKLVEDLGEQELLESVRAIHLNDSKKECGSRVDRHEHIGLGTIGLDGFQRFLKHKVFRGLPMYLETEKGPSEDGRDWDVVNLETLRSLVG